ncbi:MAG: phosphomannomutase/phosphoglucomutase [Clostridiales bacterium]|nr:phosphomannomutase/phosphoglucomutase [Clostridiales bacterium]
MNLKYLKSGTDIRGSAVETASKSDYDLTDEVVARFTAGFVDFLMKKTGKTSLLISVGHDSRVSAERISAAVKKELSAFDVDILDCGLCSTPAMFMTTVVKNCDGAVQITASHHPWDRNGLKFFTRDGGLESNELDSVIAFAENYTPKGDAVKNTVKKIDFLADYSAILRDMIKKEVNAKNYEKPLDGFKIIVDAGNGAGGFYAYDVLEPLGADISGSQFLEPDGIFPNHIPNPENKEAMNFAFRATVNSKADLGVIFDTDVDRAGCIDKSGLEINRNRLVALAAAIALEGNEGGTIVTDSVTSSGLTDFINNHLGGKHLRFKRGYKNVIDEAIRRNSEGENTPLAIETSGHAAFKENYFLDDGAYLVTKIIILAARLRKEGRDLASVISSLKEPEEAEEIRLNILCENFKEYGQKVIKELTEYAEKTDGWILADDNYEGVKVSFDKDNGNGWFLLRLSVHDPVMPLNIESDEPGGSKIIEEKIRSFLSGYEYLSKF